MKVGRSALRKLPDFTKMFYQVMYSLLVCLIIGGYVVFCGGWLAQVLTAGMATMVLHSESRYSTQCVWQRTTLKTGKQVTSITSASRSQELLAKKTTQKRFQPKCVECVHAPQKELQLSLRPTLIPVLCLATFYKFRCAASAWRSSLMQTCYR